MKIRRKITLLISLSLIIILTTNIFIGYVSIGNSVESSIANFSENLVNNSNKHFNQKEYVEWLKDPQKNDKYWELREEMNDIRVKSNSLYLYTLAVEDEKLFIIIDGFEKDSDMAVEIHTPTTATKYKDVAETFEKGVLSSTAIVHDPEYGSYLSAFAPIKDENGKVVGILGADIDASMVEEIKKEVSKSELLLLAIVNVVLFIIFIVIIHLFFRKTLMPINKLNEFTKEISNGNLKIDDLSTKSKDELGELVNSFNKMRKEIKNLIEEMDKNSDYVASSSEEFNAILDENSKSIQHITKMIQDIAEGAAEQVDTIQKSSLSIESLSNNTEQLALNIQNIDVSAKNTLARTDEGEKIVNTNIEQMKLINEKVNELVDIIEVFGKKSIEIGEKTKEITNISKQTDLLALNAAIEASRAGEAGLGFSVVADEVRKLAEESSVSAKEINEIIKAIKEISKTAIYNVQLVVTEVKQGIERTEETGETFNVIQQSITEVTGNIENVLALSEEISSKMFEIKEDIQGVENIAQDASYKTQNVSAATQQQLAAMEEISESTNSLIEVSKDLKTNVSRFNY